MSLTKENSHDCDESMNKYTRCQCVEMSLFITLLDYLVIAGVTSSALEASGTILP